MTNPKLIEVESCRDCPAFTVTGPCDDRICELIERHPSNWDIEGPYPGLEELPPPDWCPLRTLPVLVQLKEKKS